MRTGKRTFLRGRNCTEKVYYTGTTTLHGQCATLVDMMTCAHDRYIDVVRYENIRWRRRDAPPPSTRSGHARRRGPRHTQYIGYAKSS